MNEFPERVLIAKDNETHLFFVGQAGFILKSKKGKLIGVDLYLSECVERIEGNIGFKRLLPHILEPTDLEFDCIVATHPHFDHFDFDSIPGLMSNQKTQLFASVNCKYEIERLRISTANVTYIRPGDKHINEDFTLEFVPCNHGEAAPDAVGVLITIDEKKVYIAGDTCFQVNGIQEYVKKDMIDIFISPINGAYGNMNEKECAEFSKMLSPKLTIPCHYGMFAAHGGNPGIFIKEMQNYCLENKFYLMRMGEGITL